MSTKSGKPKRRLLVLDDEPDIGALICEVAEEEGFEVLVTARSGEFLDLYSRFKPDVICLDVIMPEMDGIEILKALAKKNAPCLFS